MFELLSIRQSYLALFVSVGDQTPMISSEHRRSKCPDYRMYLSSPFSRCCFVPYLILFSKLRIASRIRFAVLSVGLLYSNRDILKNDKKDNKKCHHTKQGRFRGNDSKETNLYLCRVVCLGDNIRQRGQR